MNAEDQTSDASNGMAPVEASPPQQRATGSDGLDPVGAATDILALAASMVPGIGPVAGLFTGWLMQALFPSKSVDVWESIKDQVNKVVDEKITTERFKRLTDKLTGIRDNYADYHVLVTLDDDPVSIYQKWDIVYSSVNGSIAEFQNKDYAVAQVPLFIQLANLQILLLRDLYLHGKRWGVPQGTIDMYAKKLNEFTRPTNDTENYETHYSKWAADHYQEGHSGINTDWDRLAYTRVMYVNGFQQSEIWPYLNPVKYPEGHDVVGILGAQEVFNGPWGRIPGNIPAECTAPGVSRGEITQLRMWEGKYASHKRPCGILLRYGGVYTATVGSKDGTMHDWQISNYGYMTRIWVEGQHNDGIIGVTRFSFALDSGFESEWIGNDPHSSRVTRDFSIPGYYVSSIHAGNPDTTRKNLGWMVIGFRPLPRPRRAASADPTEGKTYILRSVHNGRIAKLESLSTWPGIGIILGGGPDSTSTHWTVTDLSCLQNGYSEKYMATTYLLPDVEQTHSLHPFVFQKQHDGTYTIQSKQPQYSYLSVDQAGTKLVQQSKLDPDDRKMRWVFEEVDSARQPYTVQDGPILTLNVVEQDVGYFKAGVTLSNPENAPAAIAEGWRLSFYLPKGLGGTVNVSEGDGAELDPAQPQPDTYGLPVTVAAASWSLKQVIEPGESFTFSLTGGAEAPTFDIRDIRIRPDQPRINGRPIDDGSINEPDRPTHI
ncbi:insecticidal delta-endotoxin Cry8Ea1 family protein [Streptomyces sp. NPDC001787]|uniref:insecticidal delta-endotoxin Cry8Ea1 family protein n=1 Tax=Streptomyces sp. NPDC001787 TaxID=3154523 RepID=UPI003323F817